MLERFRTRSLELERIDAGEYTEAEYQRWQREMPWIHGFFGEDRALEKSLISEIRESSEASVSVLDVGAGSGTILSNLRTRLTVYSPFLVGAEINRDAALTIRSAGFSAVRCDGTSLPFADDSFDHAISTLTLHHLGDEEAISLVAEMARVSRGRIFLIDLNRSAVAYYAYRTFAPLVLQRLTVHDGALSILRSFTDVELLEVARKAGLSEASVKHSRLNRLVLSGEKHDRTI